MVFEASAFINLENRYGKKAIDRASSEMKQILADAAKEQDHVLQRAKSQKGVVTGRSFAEAQIENKLRFLSKGFSFH